MRYNEEKTKEISLYKKVLVVAFVLLVTLLIASAGMIWETNTIGNYQIKQAAITGEITVRNEPGMYLQWFGDIWTYKVSDEIDFEKYDMTVKFNDGSVAPVIGMIKYRLPSDEAMQKRIHRDFRSYENMKAQLIDNTVGEALAQSATLMVAEDSYSARRAEFTTTALEQVREGIYQTITKEVDSVDTNGTKFKKRIIEIAKDDKGAPIIRKVSPFKTYGIEVIQFVVTDFQYDKTITDLINKKKEAEQMKVVATANAEKAKQDAITATEQGKAKVAEAEALAQVEKIKAVVAAQKEAEVAALNAKKAQEEAKAIKAKGDAEAAVAKLKVQAGLTPLERAQIDKDTRIGIAAELAKVKFPDTMVISGGDKNGGTNPFDAIGLNALYELTDKMSKGNSGQNQ